MTFWIYENWVHEKAVIHRSECTYCRNGQGLHGTAGNGNDCWHGPFASKKGAEERAKETGRKIKKFCSVCIE